MFEMLQQRAMKDRAGKQYGTITIKNALFHKYNVHWAWTCSLKDSTWGRDTDGAAQKAEKTCV